jgi:carboxyl-terminal processing protease
VSFRCLLALVLQRRRIALLSVAYTALALLAACADLGNRKAALPADPGGKLYAKGLDEITDLYIEPVSARSLAIAGAERLSRLDNKLTITESPSTNDKMVFVLAYEGRQVAMLAVPGNANALDWGIVLANLIATAKQVSPRIAAMPGEALDKSIFDGITEKLDRFSHYSSPDAARDHRATRDGFGGIGVTLDSSGLFRVSDIAPRGPADLAGIKPGDTLVAVNGTAIAGRPQADVVHLLRGPISSAVSVTISRSGTEPPREFHLRRALVIMPTVTMTRGGKIAIFRVKSFNQSTTQRLAESIAEAQREAGGRLEGIILDLRSNPGGLLDQAVSLADLFMPEGPIVATVGRHPASRQYFGATGEGIAARVPVAILINGGSASSSEIVAAALQDAGRAVVIGSSSYGKGTVQTVIRLPNDAELTLTWARLVAPAGYFLQAHGVVPTLCTADLDDSERSLQVALQRVGPGGAASQISRVRASLDDQGWAELRKACPARPGNPEVDLKIAERLLSDSKLYSEAVGAGGPPPRLAHANQSPTAAAERSLTGPDGALSSGTRVP